MSYVGAAYIFTLFTIGLYVASVIARGRAAARNRLRDEAAAPELS